MLPTIRTLFKPAWFFVSLYIAIRLLSFITYRHPLGNEIIAGLIVGAFAFICVKHLRIGWLILLGELILDGAGHFFEWQSLLVRTWFLGIFGAVWLYSKIREKKFTIDVPRPILYSLIGVGILVLFATINGFAHNHSNIHILQDTILFCFLFLLFPALEYANASEKLFKPLMHAWIIGSTFFSALAFFIYSSGLGHLPDTFYHWFRNIAAGKITDLGNHFFRIVLPEHLFLVPIILVLAAYLINNLKNKKLWILLLCCSFILALNFTRIYFLALGVGLLVLAIKQSLKNWLVVSAATVFSILILFSATHFIASRGQSFGLELLGVKIGQTTAPQTDPSGAIRLAMMPDIVKQIKTRPWFGSGLGATVSYVDPVTKENVIRTQFDWGYFEMLAELGVVGTAIFLIFFFTVLYHLARRAYSADNNSIIKQGVLAGAAALLVMSITTPALFHGFGILYIVLLIMLTTKNLNDVSV